MLDQLDGVLLVSCDRCGAPLHFADTPASDARLLKLAEQPKGVCANCSVTGFLKTMEPLATIIVSKGSDVLLQPAVQRQMAAVIDSGQADARPDDIDWPTVVRQWDLR